MTFPQENPAAGPTPIPGPTNQDTAWASLPSLPALDNTVGALLIGTFIGLMQYGWTANQCYRYYRTYSRDRRLFKIFVMCILVSETFHSIICMHFCYHILVTNYFNPEALSVIVWSLQLWPIASGLVVPIAQSLFLFRLYMIGHIFRPLVILVALLLLGELGIAFYSTLQLFIFPKSRAEMFGFGQWVDPAYLGLAALADMITSAALIYIFHRSRTGFKSTDTLLDTLTMYTINTGLLNGVTNMASFICAIAMPQNLIFGGITIVATKLYANTVMTVLNARSSLASGKGMTMDTYSLNIPLDSTSRSATDANPGNYPIPTQLSLNTGGPRDRGRDQGKVFVCE